MYMLTEEDKVRLIDVMGATWFQHIPMKYVRRALRLWTQEEMAARVGTTAEMLRVRVERGQVPAPDVFIGQRRYWSDERARDLDVAWEEGGFYKGRGRYSADDVQKMREYLALGWTQWKVAHHFNCSQSEVSRLTRGLKNSRRVKI